jgi:hypothetical protein
MHGAAAGAVTGVVAVACGMLAAGLPALLGAHRAVPPAADPSWREWLAGTVLGTAVPSPGTAAVALAVLLVCVLAGIAARRRLVPGVALLLAAGGVAAWVVLLPGSSPAVVSVPVAATAAGVVALALLRPGPPDPDGGPRMTRRRALIAGALLAAGTGAAAAARSRPRELALPAAGGPAQLARGPVVNVRDLGAAGDGRTDDGDAIRRGMAELNRAGGTLFFPAGTYYYRATAPLRPAAGVTLAGQPGASTIAFDFPGARDFVDFCSIDAAGVTIDGLVIRRVAEFPAVLLSLGAADGFTFTRGALVGNTDALPGADCHGIKFPDGGTAGGIRIADSAFATLTYGLLQANASTATVTGVTVERCTFTRGSNTDLEFNSPYGSIRQIRVTGCAFTDNDSLGFGVGLAHVADAVVRGNTFDRYALEAVHIEDHSTDVTVQDNVFTACGLRDYSHVQIISGSQRVWVMGNTFHATMNTRPIYVVNALPGGDGPTAGGRPTDPPSGVTVERNTFDCKAPAVPVYFERVRNGVIRDNTITASGDPYRLEADPGTAIADNTVNGRR